MRLQCCIASVSVAPKTLTIATSNLIVCSDERAIELKDGVYVSPQRAGSCSPKRSAQQS